MVSACILVPTVLLYVFQDSFVYATFVDPDPPPVHTALPDGQAVRYRTDDGLDLVGWFVPSRQPAPACGPASSAVVFHGQAGSRDSQSPLASALADRGINVFIGEYRGFGGMPGSPSEDGLVIDADAAVTALGAQPGVDPNRIAYVGFSLGTGVAVSLAAQRPPQALVLLAPYTSLPDVAWTRLPGIPYRLLMRTQFDSLARIGSIDAPLAVVIGTNDDTVPNEQSRQVFRSAPHHELLLPVEGAGHIEIDVAMPKPTADALATFVHTHTDC